MPKEVKEKKAIKQTKTEKTKREPKIRPIEELEEMSIKSMTGHEAKAMVTHLRERLILAEKKEEELRKNIESTRQQNQETIKKAESMERFYRKRMAYTMECATNLFNSVDLATKGLVE